MVDIEKLNLGQQAGITFMNSELPDKPNFKTIENAIVYVFEKVPEHDRKSAWINFNDPPGTLPLSEEAVMAKVKELYERIISTR
jgi:hypothetical protein